MQWAEVTISQRCKCPAAYLKVRGIRDSENLRIIRSINVCLTYLKIMLSLSLTALFTLVSGPPAPLSVTKMFYSNGTYEISWKPPANAVDVLSYTIFVCNGSRHSPYQCNVLLSWNVVDPDQTTFIYKDLPAHVVFQFGVSVNTKERGSSGMVLANCELVFNKGRHIPGAGNSLDSIC